MGQKPSSGFAEVAALSVRVQKRYMPYLPAYTNHAAAITPDTLALAKQHWLKIVAGTSAFANQKCGNGATEAKSEPISFFYDSFYNELFALAPSARDIFKGQLVRQGKALVGMFTWMVNLDLTQSASELAAKMEGLADRHVAYGCNPSHYDAVGLATFHALRVCSGVEDWTPPVQAVWVDIYSVFLLVMVPRTVMKMEELGIDIAHAGPLSPTTSQMLGVSGLSAGGGGASHSGGSGGVGGGGGGGKPSDSASASGSEQQRGGKLAATMGTPGRASSEGAASFLAQARSNGSFSIGRTLRRKSYSTANLGANSNANPPSAIGDDGATTAAYEGNVAASATPGPSNNGGGANGDAGPAQGKKGGFGTPKSFSRRNLRLTTKRSASMNNGEPSASSFASAATSHSVSSFGESDPDFVSPSSNHAAAAAASAPRRENVKRDSLDSVTEGGVPSFEDAIPPPLDFSLQQGVSGRRGSGSGQRRGSGASGNSSSSGHALGQGSAASPLSSADTGSASPLVPMSQPQLNRSKSSGVRASSAQAASAGPPPMPALPLPPPPYDLVLESTLPAPSSSRHRRRSSRTASPPFEAAPSPLAAHAAAASAGSSSNSRSARPLGHKRELTPSGITLPQSSKDAPSSFDLQQQQQQQQQRPSSTMRAHGGSGSGSRNSGDRRERPVSNASGGRGARATLDSAGNVPSPLSMPSQSRSNGVLPSPDSLGSPSPTGGSSCSSDGGGGNDGRRTGTVLMFVHKGSADRQPQQLPAGAVRPRRGGRNEGDAIY